MRHFSKDTVQITTARVINERNKEFWGNGSRNTYQRISAAVEENTMPTNWDIDDIVDKMITADITINKSQEKKPAKKKAVKISDYNKRSIEF